MNDKAENLALLNVVETYNADVAIAILRTARLDFVEYFVGALSAEQRQFPHCPVAFGWLGRFVKFNRRNITLAEDVLNLLGNLSIAQGGKVGKGFVPTLFW